MAQHQYANNYHLHIDVVIVARMKGRGRFRVAEGRPFMADTGYCPRSPEKSDVLRVDSQVLAGFQPDGGGWRDNALKVAGGQVCFRTGQVSPGIAATRSDCRLRGEFRSHIEHFSSVGILAFGVSGTSLFGFDRGEPSHAVRSGDVWLFRLNDGIMNRRTPAQEAAGMVAIKFDTERVAAVLDHTMGRWERDGTRAVRLGRWDADREGGPQAFMDNPLHSSLDRLMAESQALGLLARWLAPLPSVPAVGVTMGRDERRALARVVDLLVSDLCYPPSLDRLAELAGMSHVRLNRCFRDAYGKTVFAWLRDYRLEQARRHLLEGEASVTEIAFLCGFSSSSHLAAAFKERYGCCPADLRRQRR
jgi:AraC-like DNA-binding protein